MYNILIALISLALMTLIFRKRYLIMMRDHVLPPPPMVEFDNITLEEDTFGIQGDDDRKPLDFSEINRIFRIGDMHFFRGELEEAEKYFIKVLSLYERHNEALNRLGVIYIQQKQPYKAELLYRRLLGLEKKEAIYHSNFARCLYNQKKYDDAIEAYETALALDPKRGARHVSLGQIYYELGKYAKALEHFLSAHEREPKNLDYLQLVADLYEFFADTKNTETFLLKITALDPYNKFATAKLEKLRGERPATSREAGEGQMELL